MHSNRLPMSDLSSAFLEIAFSLPLFVLITAFSLCVPWYNLDRSLSR